MFFEKFEVYTVHGRGAVSVFIPDMQLLQQWRESSLHCIFHHFLISNGHTSSAGGSDCGGSVECGAEPSVVAVYMLHE